MNFYTLLFLLSCVSACKQTPTPSTDEKIDGSWGSWDSWSFTVPTTPTTKRAVTAIDTTTATKSTSNTTSTPTTTAETTKIQCPNGWIDAQSQNLGCVNFFNEVSLTWFEAYEVCQEKKAYLVEALSRDEAEFLFQMAEMIQFYSSNETWWIGLTDFYGRYFCLINTLENI